MSLFLMVYIGVEVTIGGIIFVNNLTLIVILSLITAVNKIGL